jgi:hypothetical protein
MCAVAILNYLLHCQKKLSAQNYILLALNVPNCMRNNFKDLLVSQPILTLKNTHKKPPMTMISL